MNKQIVVVTLLLAVIAAAYEFDDPVYNQILANELEDLETSLDEPFSHLRTRRDEGGAGPDKCGPFRKKKMCCGGETFHKMHEEDKDIKRECFKKHMIKDESGPHDPFNCEKMQKQKKAMICMSQCTFQKKGAVDDKGALIHEAVTKQLEEMMSPEPWFASIKDKVLKTCFDEVKAKSEENNDSDSESCDPSSAIFMHCLFKEIQMNCPAEAIKDQKSCTKLREKIQKYGYMPMPPHPMPHDD